MKLGFKSSWWVHIPAMTLICIMVAATTSQRPWPGRVPVHFNLRWEADRWGSPWEATIFPFLAAMAAVAGMFLSAAWAREERGHKRFNLVLPLVAAPLGAVAGLHLWYWYNLPALSQAGHAPGPWWWVAVAAGINLAATLILESFRKSPRI